MGPGADCQGQEGKCRLDSPAVSYLDARIANCSGEGFIKRKEEGTGGKALHIGIRIIPHLR